jgi:subtilisin family serine protease
VYIAIPISLSKIETPVMKNIIWAFSLLLIANIVLGQQKTTGVPKLSPRTQQYLLQLKKATGKTGPLPDYVYRKTADGIYMSAMIKVSSTGAEAGIEALGGRVNTKAGNIWTVQIPLNKVPEFVKTAGISYIELDEPVCMKLDSVRKVTHVDSVQKGIGLAMPYTGKGVIVGIVDAGFDFTQPALFDTTGGSYRVQRVWEEKVVGNPPAGFGYGNEITDTTAMKAAQTDNGTFSHGMHVTGIAAGSGHGSATNDNWKYRGMAFQSDLVLVGIMPDSTEWENTGMSDYLDGINYVFGYAATQSKPAVVNLSWGNSFGPHDGTSLFSQGCDALTGAGKIFVCAGGNNGTDHVHLQQNFTATDTTISTFINFDPTLVGTPVNTLDVWGDSAQTFCLKFSLYNDSLITYTNYFCVDDTIHEIYLLGTNGDTCYISLVTSTEEFNGKPRAYMYVTGDSLDSICMTIRGTSGQINLWDAYVRDGEGYYGQLTSNGRSWATDGDSLYCTSDVAATNSVIAAGAYTSKVSFRNISNQSLYYPGAVVRALASFSSRGPTVDGRIKPDISAPGFGVVSTVNSFDSSFIKPTGANYQSTISSFHSTVSNRNYYFAILAGTSMASPATSGIVALMLQANPNLTPTEIKNILAQTAILDTFTGPLTPSGDNNWGHGKINAYQAVIAAAALNTAVTNIPGATLAFNLFPNPNKGAYTITFNSSIEDNMNIEVFDLNGRTIFAETWSVSAGLNSKTLDISKLNSGIYITKLSSVQGSAMIKTTVVK